MQHMLKKHNLIVAQVMKQCSRYLKHMPSWGDKQNSNTRLVFAFTNKIWNVQVAYDYIEDGSQPATTNCTMSEFFIYVKDRYLLPK